MMVVRGGGEKVESGMRPLPILLYPADGGGTTQQFIGKRSTKLDFFSSTLYSPSREGGQEEGDGKKQR